ncbi:LacI family DNA-binding transcriptional regulator [Streptomyces shenzhenensis]|uniref:LacI family DNA-binding transcriptional regulator n=1 Tax=Streptomyces shenzhenensis TaxID=943815 RepID=UPI00381F3C0C
MAGDGGPVTLRGIAERLGLHVSTVSRVLNGPSGEQGRAASGETARRIRELAQELGYRPNPHATSLRTRRSNLVGVLFPRLSEIVVATIYEGVEAEARLGARHPLTLRLRVSHAMLGCDRPGGVPHAEQVVNDAAVHLGEGHPTVRDARTLLAVLRSTGAG